MGMANSKIWTQSSPSHRSRIRMTSQCFKSHKGRCTSDLWSVDRLLWATSSHSWLWVLKVQKVKGRCKTKQECAIKVTAYWNSADWPVVLFLTCIMSSCHTWELRLLLHFHSNDPLQAAVSSAWPCIVLLSFTAVSKTPQSGHAVIFHPLLLYQMASSLMETLCPLSVCGVVTGWVKESVCWQIRLDSN